MRWIIRQLLFHLAALITASQLIAGFNVVYETTSLAYTTLALATINVFIKPLVKIFFLPLNLITLNLFSLIINMGVVYALTRIVPTVSVTSWHFAGLALNGFVIPSFEFTVLYTYLAVSIILTTTVSLLNWVCNT